MSAAYENLQVYKSAKDLVVYFEIIVRGFQRYHKYTIGSEIRQFSYAVLDGARLRLFFRGTIGKEEMSVTVASYLGHFKWANSYRLRSKLLRTAELKAEEITKQGGGENGREK